MRAVPPQPDPRPSRLRRNRPYGKDRRASSAPIDRHCCRSSVVEHSLGKGEVVSSILPGSTRFPFEIRVTWIGAHAVVRHFHAERSVKSPPKYGENPGTWFASCSCRELGNDTSVQMIERHYARWIADGLEEL